MGKYRSKYIKHRRGGAYQLENAAEITNWHYKQLSNECKHQLLIGDVVRIIIDEHKKYVEITRILSKTHFLGTISDPYKGGDRGTCNHCERWIEPQELMACNGDVHNSCDYHLHKKCHEKLLKNKNAHEHDVSRVKYVNGDKLVFKKNNIMEIPNWTENTSNL